MPPRPSNVDTRSVLEESATRVSRILAGTRGDVGIPRLEWTVSDLGAHLVSVTRWFALQALEDVSPSLPYSRLAEFNRIRIEEVGERDPHVLARELDRAVAGFLESTSHLSGAALARWYDGHAVDLIALNGVMAAEFLIHGLDVARAAGEPWPIEERAALTAILALLPVVPTTLSEYGRRFSGRFQVRLRRGPTVGLVFENGGLTLDDGHDAADCILSVDPVAFLLVSYGRVPAWKAAATGRALAWGRRPWWAFLLPRLFRV